MPSIDINFLLCLKQDNLLEEFPYFIETGTLIGDTTFKMEKYFEKVWTIELSEIYYNIVKSKYQGNKIEFILGDSSKVFKYLLPNIDKDAVFFLDGHWSGGNTAKGDKDCPLLEEIDCINNLFRNRGIIIIDDVRLFGLGPESGKLNENWRDITQDKIEKILKERTDKVYFLPSKLNENDRMIIHLKSIC